LKSSQSSETRKIRRTVDLFIEKPVYGGYGLAREGGRVYLVRYTAPGEFLRAAVIKEKKDHREAIPLEVKIPSEGRREPPCPYFGKCGGCHYQHLDYDLQVRIKEMILEESLGRLGKIREIPGIESIRSPEEFGYRIRVQFKGQGDRLGFFRWGENELVPIDHCPITHPKINDLIPSLRSLSAELNFPCELHLTFSPYDGKYLLVVVTPTEIDRAVLESLRENLPEDVVGIGNYLRVGRSLTMRKWIGREYLLFEVKGKKFRVSGGSFFQVNHTLWEGFIDTVCDDVKFRKGVELYSGVGFFSLFLAERGNFLEASDSNPSAVNDAQYNTKINGVENLIFIKSDAHRHLKMRGGEVLDLLVVDPPRSGLTQKERELILKNKPERVVYVSCNPATLARDLGDLIRGGYRLKRIVMVDNFPQTYHIESVSFLEVQE